MKICYEIFTAALRSKWENALGVWMQISFWIRYSTLVSWFTFHRLMGHHVILGDLMRITNLNLNCDKFSKSCWFKNSYITRGDLASWNWKNYGRPRLWSFLSNLISSAKLRSNVIIQKISTERNFSTIIKKEDYKRVYTDCTGIYGPKTQMCTIMRISYERPPNENSSNWRMFRYNSRN